MQFVLPLGLAAICKATIATAERAIYQMHPIKMLDLSIDLLLTATSILLGVLKYVRSGAVTSTPTGTPIKTDDLAVGGITQIAALILIYASPLWLPQMGWVPDKYLPFEAIWVPDVFRTLALWWVIAQLPQATYAIFNSSRPSPDCHRPVDDRAVRDLSARAFHHRPPSVVRRRVHPGGSWRRVRLEPNDRIDNVFGAPAATITR